MVDLETRCVRRAGQRIDLTPREFDLLVYLLRRPFLDGADQWMTVYTLDFIRNLAAAVLSGYIATQNVWRDGPLSGTVC